MFGDSNSSELQEQVLDLTDRIYNSWVNWVSTNKTRIQIHVNLFQNNLCLEISPVTVCAFTQLCYVHVPLSLAIMLNWKY